jgi:AraC-like DNA-binding protein
MTASAPRSNVRSRPKSDTLPAIFVTSVMECAAARGAPRELLLAGAGLDARALRDPEAPVPLRAVYGVWATAMRTLRDDGFPIAVARGFRLEHYPTLGFAVMTAPTGYEAIARVVRFSGIIATAGRWETQGHRDHLRVRWLRDGERTLGHRAANESVLAELLHGLRQAFGEDVAATAVSLRHPAPRDTRAHRAYFGVPIQWSARHDEIHLPRALLECSPRFSNPSLSAHFERQAATLLEEARRAVTVVDRVTGALRETLTSGEPSSVAIARRLGMSERTLRRALAAEQSSFRAIVEDVRRVRANELLRDRTHSLAEIALSLGFSELSAFSRAFRRWEGRAPSEARQARSQNV